MFIVGVDLGQSQDYTAIAIIERIIGPGAMPTGRPEAAYQLRYLHRPVLGTKYPAVVAQVIGLLDQAPHGCGTYCS